MGVGGPQVSLRAPMGDQAGVSGGHAQIRGAAACLADGSSDGSGIGRTAVVTVADRVWLQR